MGGLLCDFSFHLRGRRVTLFSFVFLFSSFPFSSAVISFRGNSAGALVFNPFVFNDLATAFAVPMNEFGLDGSLQLADPLHACSPLRKNMSSSTGAAEKGSVRFALIERGQCGFGVKVGNARDAGFRPVLVYGDDDLISEEERAQWPEAVFVPKKAGEMLKELARNSDGGCSISVLSDEIASAIIGTFLVALSVLTCVVHLLAFVRLTRTRLPQPQSGHPKRRPAALDSPVVETLPSFVYGSARPNHRRSSKLPEACAICLEDYRDGDSLRVLPCKHEYHTVCVDSWLTSWGTCCPLCKHDMRDPAGSGAPLRHRGPC
ncbi:hypothetical protein H6P81_018495 [Aristolochia fimbriata]|uniref:RING-type E3 ubiquitin transferase n=1 Tax=Aristolochia fimbriata TaxID=158543 RepID=A0AAV7E2T1_ARIFI|nr:hypothetical protein H6P81_018495 [Aristolochia fimbriata]